MLNGPDKTRPIRVGSGRIPADRVHFAIPTWSLLLCICKYVIQSNVKLMVPWWKYIFSECVGSKCWMLTFTLSLFFLFLFFSFFFFLVYYQRGFVEALARNIWPKARVACIFCYGLTHLCQTHCSSAISNLKFLLFMLLCKVLTTQVLTCNLV